MSFWDAKDTVLMLKKLTIVGIHIVGLSEICAECSVVEVRMRTEF